MKRFPPTLLAAACALLAVAPALFTLTRLAARYDWRYFESMGEVSRRSVLWWHQVPLWNPYSCGGEVALANPQSLDASPTFPLVLLFGVAVGYKLALALYHFCAIDGARRLGRRLGLSDTGALLAGLGYGLSGYLALHWSEGHVTFLGVALFPYLLYCYDRALDEIEWAIPVGLVAAWILTLGGTFTPPMAAELLLVWAAIAAVRRRSARPFALLALGGAVALVASAVRMFPVLEFVRDHPRPAFMREPDRTAIWNEVLDVLAWRPFGPLAGRKYWSHEYAARLPWVLAPLWALGLWLALRKRLPAERVPAARALLVVVVWGTLLATGNFASFAPWTLLQGLPVLRDLRVPSRHEVLIVLGLALLAGLAWDEVARWIDERRVRVPRHLAAIVIALAAIDGVAYCAYQWYGVFVEDEEIPEARPAFYHVESDWKGMRRALFAGHGALGCDEEAPLQRAESLDADDVPQERLLDPSAGEVVGATFSPNRRVVTVALARPTILLVNSNWNEHWRADRGRVTKIAGRLAVDLPAGRHEVTLTYAPRSFTVGATVTGIGLPSLLGLFAWARRRRRQRT